MLTGIMPSLTKETVKSAHSISFFSNEKIRIAFPEFKFITIEQSIKDTCRLFLRDKKAPPGLPKGEENQRTG